MRHTENWLRHVLYIRQQIMRGYLDGRIARICEICMGNWGKNEIRLVYTDWAELWIVASDMRVAIISRHHRSLRRILGKRFVSLVVLAMCRRRVLLRICCVIVHTLRRSEFGINEATI